MPEVKSVNVLITGAFNLEKTSFIRAVSEFDCVSTELKYFKNNSPEKFQLSFGLMRLEESHSYIFSFADGNLRLPPISTWFLGSRKFTASPAVCVLLIDHRTVASEDIMPPVEAGSIAARFLNNPSEVDSIAARFFAKNPRSYDPTAETKGFIKLVQGHQIPYMLIAPKRKDGAAYSLTEMRMRLGLPAEIPFWEIDPIEHPHSFRLALAELLSSLPQDDLVQAAITKLSENSI